MTRRRLRPCPRARPRTTTTIAVIGAMMLLLSCTPGDGNSGGDDDSADKPDGAGSAPAHTVDWDLSASHRVGDVDWPASRADRDLFTLQHGVDARLRLPQGTVLEERFEDLQVVRRDDTEVLRVIEAVWPKRTLDDAHALAQRVGDQFDLDLAGYQAWHRDQQQRLAEGRTLIAETNANGPPLAPGGPVPSIRPLYSFDDDAPVSLLIQLYWPPPDDT